MPKFFLEPYTSSKQKLNLQAGKISVWPGSETRYQLKFFVLCFERLFLFQRLRDILVKLNIFLWLLS